MLACTMLARPMLLTTLAADDSGGGLSTKITFERVIVFLTDIARSRACRRRRCRGLICRRIAHLVAGAETSPNHRTRRFDIARMYCAYRRHPAQPAPPKRRSGFRIRWS